jgi:glycosyltransferase involved in cell wall biosynthesis
MRVLYDGIVFQNSYQRGIQRAFREMIDHFPPTSAAGGVEAVLALADRPKCALPKRVRVERTTPAIVGYLHRRVRKWLIPRLSPGAMRRLSEGCDVFHSTYYTLPPREMPTVCHVHDLIPEKFPEMFGDPWAAAEIEQRRVCIAQAMRIITISRATADDVAARYPEAAGKIRTVYFGCDHLRRAAGAGSRSASPGGARYALYVGERTKYKNFRVVFEAMGCAAWPKDVGLVVAGPPFKEDERTIADGLAARGLSIRHAGRPTDAELAVLYAGAMCVVVPSLCEGFGFPVLEGQAAGTVVVCSDVPVFREVAGAGAIFFDPKKPEELARAVGEAGDAGVRGRVLAAGAENLVRFTWDGCAREVAEVYRSMLE